MSQGTTYYRVVSSPIGKLLLTSDGTALTGVHMTPHQFRHFGATSYLEQHPEDFETARALLGHGWSKTTRIYAGSSSRRASRAYNQYLLKQREALKLLRPRRRRRG